MLEKSVFRRLKNDGTVYLSEESYMADLASMDDLMAFGKPDDAKQFFQGLHKHRLLNDTGKLNANAVRIRFRGRSLESGATIFS